MPGLSSGVLGVGAGSSIKEPSASHFPLSKIVFCLVKLAEVDQLVS